MHICQCFAVSVFGSVDVHLGVESNMIAVAHCTADYVCLGLVCLCLVCLCQGIEKALDQAMAHDIVEHT